jgi:hypothetical protein
MPWATARRHRIITARSWSWPRTPIPNARRPGRPGNFWHRDDKAASTQLGSRVCIAATNPHPGPGHIGNEPLSSHTYSSPRRRAPQILWCAHWDGQFVGMRIVDRHELHTRIHQGRYECQVPGQAVELGNDELGFLLFADREGLDHPAGHCAPAYRDLIDYIVIQERPRCGAHLRGPPHPAISAVVVVDHRVRGCEAGHHYEWSRRDPG